MSKNALQKKLRTLLSRDHLINLFAYWLYILNDYLFLLFLNCMNLHKFICVNSCNLWEYIFRM